MYFFFTDVIAVLPTTHCDIIMRFLCFCIAFATASASVLFYMRVLAVYNRSKPVAAFFGAIWILLVGVSLPIPFFITTGHIGPTNFCIITSVNSWLGSPEYTFGVLAAFDILVFVFISRRLIKVLENPSTHRPWWKATLSLFRSEGLPQFSKTIVQHGQKYFL